MIDDMAARQLQCVIRVRADTDDQIRNRLRAMAAVFAARGMTEFRDDVGELIEASLHHPKDSVFASPFSQRGYYDPATVYDFAKFVAGKAFDHKLHKAFEADRRTGKQPGFVYPLRGPYFAAFESAWAASETTSADEPQAHPTKALPVLSRDPTITP